ncbi:MAG: hypothetical protein NVS2B12_21770 [Ktedonobacteraceae bacterium]
MEMSQSPQDGQDERAPDLPTLAEVLGIRDQQLITILEGMSDGFCVLDRGWRYIYLNQRIEEITGRKRATLIGKIHWEVFPDAINSIFYKKFHEAMEQQVPVTFEAFYAPSDKWYVIQVSPSPGGLAIFARNVTDQKRAEVQMLYQAQIAQSISDALVVTDMQYVIRSWNRAAEELYGWKAEEVLGKNAADIVPGVYQTDSRSIFQHEITTRGMWKGEVLQSHKDGTARYILASVSIVKDQDGNVLGMVAANRDISERKRREEENKRLLQQLQIERAQLEAVLQQMPSGVIIAEALSGKLILENKQVEEIWRQPMPEVASISDYTKYQGFHPDGRAYKAEEWPLARSILYGEIVHAEEIVYVRGDKTRGTMQVSSAPIRDEQGNILIGVVIFTDITKQKEAEQRKDEFISTASHELRTPLTTVKATTQLLKRTAIKRNLPEIALSLTKMEGQINLLTRLIAELLDVSKIQAGQIDYLEEPIEIDGFVHEVVETFQLIAPSHRIIVSGSTQQQISGDRGRLEQVLVNLLNNAVKYSPHAQQVDIILSSDDEEHAIIRVRDYGNGIAREDQSRIFERFYRASNPYSKTIAGLGMGLYIASEIVKRHAGQINVESKVGEGSTFSVMLPSA